MICKCACPDPGLLQRRGGNLILKQVFHYCSLQCIIFPPVWENLPSFASSWLCLSSGEATTATAEFTSFPSLLLSSSPSSACCTSRRGQRHPVEPVWRWALLFLACWLCVWWKQNIAPSKQRSGVKMKKGVCVSDVYLCAVLICSVGLLCMCLFTVTVTCQYIQRKQSLKGQQLHQKQPIFTLCTSITHTDVWCWV